MEVEEMGLIARILGLGPLLLSGVIIACLLLIFSSSALAPYTPFMGVAMPVLILGLLAWRRSYPAAVGWLRRMVKPESFWNAALPDLRILKVVTTDKELSRFHQSAGKTLIFEDKSGRGYACKVLRVADITSSYETTTEDERLLLLSSMAKVIEGLGDVEAKMVIDRSPETGETAYMILWSEIVDGDEKSAVYSVENAAKTIQKSMDTLGIALVDDISYMEPRISLKTYTNPPRRLHAVMVAASSVATMFSSAMSMGAGLMPMVMLGSGFIGLLISNKLWKASLKAGCGKCPGKPHSHTSLGYDVQAYQVDSGGVLKEYRERGVIYSKYLAFTGNNNRGLPYEDVERRLPMSLRSFSALLYTLRDFRIAIHVKPQPVGDTVRLALAKADFYGMDAQVGGAVSGYFKAGRSMNLADRIMRGERPYIISGVVEVRARVDGESEARALDLLDKQLREAQSFLDTMNLSSREVKDGWGAVLAKRFLYLPPPRTDPLEYDPICRIKALTKDFIAISPLAFRRRPLMPREGLYIGRDGMGRPVYWNPSTVPNPHILILGGVGSGKSTLVKTMLFRLQQLAKYSGTGKPPSVIIIDPAGEYADKAELLKGLGLNVKVIDLVKHKYNPLLLAGLEPKQRAARLVDYIFANIIPLDRFQSGVLYQAIMLAYKKLCKIDEYNPETWTDEAASKATLKHIYDYIAWRAEQVAKNVASRGGSPEVDPAVTLLTELARLLLPMATGAFALDRTDITPEKLLGEGGIVIVSFKTSAEDVRVRMSDELQKIITWSILDHIYSYMTSQRAEEGCRLMVVVDEGHKFLRGVREDVPLGQHLREGRKFGVSYVMVTHLPRDLPEDVEKLVGTMFIGNFSHPPEARRIADLLNLTEEEYKKIMALKTGEMYVRWMGDPRPLWFKVEPDERALVRRREDRLWQLYKMQ
jgi:hypothetical protein